jgi:hypothetical protein
MPYRTTRANLSNPPNLEPTWIRSSLTALAQRLFAATDTSTRGQESTRYFRSSRIVAHHGIGRVRAGNLGIAAQSMLGILQPTLTRSLPAINSKQARWCTPRSH